MKKFKCPRCSGEMYVDPGYEDEAYCIACGHVEYDEDVTPTLMPDPFEYEEV